MNSKLSRIPKDLRAQRESSYGRRQRESKYATRFDGVGERNLAQCDASKRQRSGCLSMNFFVPTSNDVLAVSQDSGRANLRSGLESSAKPRQDGRTHKEPRMFRVFR